MKFDVIIMNPPYGYQSSVAKKTIKKLGNVVKSVTYLTPKNVLKDSIILQHSNNIREIDNIFDAKIEKLIVAQYSNSTKNTESYEKIALKNLDKSYTILYEAIQNYNNTHKPQIGDIKLFGAPNEVILKRSLKEASSHKVDKLKTIQNMSIQELIENNQLFIRTTWTPSNGVSISESHGWTYNRYGKWDDDWNKKQYAINAFVFINKKERDNFSNWWYSCLEKQKVGKKQRIGLTNKFLDLIKNINGGCGAGYFDCFPNLDWSHSWIDEEILEEIGLSKDFLNGID